MGKIHDSILSGTTGRTGRIMVTNLFGNEYTRIRPRKRTGQPSPKQVLVQQRLIQAADFMASYRKFACQYFGKRIGVKSRYNNAFSNVLDAFTIDFTAEQITLHHSEVMFFKGHLLGIIPISLVSTEANSFTINWMDNSGTDLDRQTDLLQVLFVDSDEPYTTYLKDVEQRTTGSYTANVLSLYSGKTLHVWASFVDTDTQTASNSIYFGTVVIQ